MLLSFAFLVAHDHLSCMTSLVPYASSDEEDTADVEEHRDGVQLRRARLSAFGERSGETEEGGARVHTSLGVAASRPLKGDWLSYAYVPSEFECG